MAAGDLNGDGLLDLVTANQNSSDVTVFLGDGDGGFLPARSSPAGLEPNTLTLVDLNGDGRLDAVVPNIYTSEISILLGNGDGSFNAAPSVSTSGITDWPSPTVATDLNGDGAPDLIFVIPDSTGSAGLGVALGNGDGTFQPAQITANNVLTTWLAVGDFNRDGLVDVVAVSPPMYGRLWYFAGNGDGTFQAPVDLPTGGVPPMVAQAVDFNGDGLLDLVIGDETLSTTYGLSVQLGRGDGTFDPPIDTLNVGAGYLLGSDSLALADFDRDGVLDVATAAYGNEVQFHRGTPDGALLAPESYAAGTQAVALVAGDFNGDGLPDLAVANFQSNDVSVLLNAACPRSAP